MNVNPLFKAENIEHVTFNNKQKRNDRKITLKREILNQQILKGNNISILTDTRLNAADVRDIEEQLSNTHKVYSTETMYKRTGITITVETKINLKIDYKSNLTTKEGPRVLVISGTMPNKKITTIKDGYELLNSIALNSHHNLTRININRRLHPKSQNNFFNQEFLSDPIFNERVEDEIYIHISRMAKRNMPINDSRTLDETIEDEVDTQDLNLDFLYNLIQEPYFKINDSRKKNKFQKITKH